jgi:DNA-binding response OmpR family regulator
MSHILIIDDEEDARATFQDFLEGEGYRVTLASDGGQGIKMFEADRPDLIITDLLMPNKEGIETILELRKKNADVRIIAVSGGGAMGRLDFLDMAKGMGADHVIAKPVDLDELLAAVRTLLSAPAPSRSDYPTSGLR